MLFRIMPCPTPVPRALPLVFAALIVAASRAVLPACAAETGPAATDTLAAHVTRDAEYHAPSEKDLFTISRQLDYASLQFERHIGERVPKTPVWVFGSAAQARASRVNADSRVLVWIGPTQRVARPRAAVRGAAVAAADTSDPEPAFMHAWGHAVVDGWARRARRAAGTMAGGIGVTGASPADAAKHATDPALPAWFQEAIASLCEPVPAQRARMQSARATLDRRIPFPELLAGPVPEDPRRAKIFVDESHALMRFIIEREDEPFLRQIAVALAAGKPTSQALVNAKTIYSKPESLEKQWVDWMKTPKP